MGQKSVCIFPGQGSQKVGMGQDFYENSTLAKEMLEQASDRLKLDFKKLLFEENTLLDQTEFSQPVILLVSLIAYALFQEKKPSFIPSAFLGHSLGEFSALSAAGAMDYCDALELVHQRGLLMKQACEGKNAGMMALLGLDDSRVEALIQKAKQEGKSVWAANYNGDGQIVIAGVRDDLVALEPIFKEAGAKKSVLLAMSVASHCPLLSSAQAPLGSFLDRWLKEHFSAPIISNVTSKGYSNKEDAKRLLCEQLVSPVQYKQSILSLENQTDMFIEFGATVLKGLNKRISTHVTHSIVDMKSLDEVLAFIE